MSTGNWLESNNPSSMLAALPTPSARRLRLFAVGCVRHVLPLIRRERVRVLTCVEAAEQSAEGLIPAEVLAELHGAARYQREDELIVASATCIPDELSAAREAIRLAEYCMPAIWVRANPGKRRDSRGARTAVEAEREAQVIMLRCIFGNAIQATDFLPTWRTDTVLTLAHQMYESREFSAMPILADALQDARCDNDDILEHCRGPGPHVRGCWVVDLILGKE
jgi:hypothetical protein